VSEPGALISAVTVFCGSSDVVDARYFVAAARNSARRWRSEGGGSCTAVDE